MHLDQFKTFEKVIQVRIEREKFAVLTIDQAGNRANVIDQTLLDALESFIDFVINEQKIQGAVLTSGKTTFIAGADINSIEASLGRKEKPSAADLFDEAFSLSGLLRKMETGGKPFVCALNGIAMGGGLEIALACITESQPMIDSCLSDCLRCN